MAVALSALLLPWALLAAGPQVAGAGQEGREAALAELRTEIGRLEERARQIRGRETTLENQLERAETELSLQEMQLQEALTAGVVAHERLRATELRIGDLESALEGTRGDLRRRLTGLYGLGREGYTRLFLSLEPGAGLLPAIRQLRYLARRDQVALQRFRSAREELESERELQAEQQREIEDWRRREQERRDRLAEYRRVREDLLEKIRRERRELGRRAAALAAKERKLSRLIQALLDSSSTLDGASIQDFKGVLDWPAQGPVVGEFGPRTDPRYGTEVPHNGLDLELPAGTPVRAIYPGNVVFADDFEGYGKMVVLLHPGRVFSLYAGLSELRRAKGDVLSLGDVVGSAEGQLYFEIRHENVPEDPRDWLR